MVIDPQRTVVVATGNAHKLSEIRAILGVSGALAGMDFVALGELGDYPDPVEDGQTFFDNALIKAQAALECTGLRMAVADDSGLVVDALDGAPGVYSARWAGEHGNDAANNAKLLEEMRDVPDAERAARFHSSVVFVSRDEDGEEVLAGSGDCEGSIAHDLRGTHGFGYDPLFELADLPGTRMAELAPEQKNALSHRRRALDDLLKKLA